MGMNVNTIVQCKISATLASIAQRARDEARVMPLIYCLFGAYTMS